VADKPKAVVLFSGGLDSTTVLAIASKDYECIAVSFDYRQRHASELEAKAIHEAKERLDDVLSKARKVIDEEKTKIVDEAKKEIVDVVIDATEKLTAQKIQGEKAEEFIKSNIGITK